jgi:hypothetical protein
VPHIKIEKDVMWAEGGRETDFHKFILASVANHFESQRKSHYIKILKVSEREINTQIETELHFFSVILKI